MPTTIENDKKEYHIWLVWAKYKNGRFGLIAVTTSERKANVYRTLVKRDYKCIEDAMVEHTLANHLHGNEFFTLMKAEHQST